MGFIVESQDVSYLLLEVTVLVSSILTLSKWTHCSFQLKAKDFDSSLFAVDGKEASLVRTESLHAYFGKPDKEVSLGIIEFEISDYDKVENYFNTKPKGTTLNAVLWFLGLKETLQHATVTTDVLNILGYKVNGACPLNNY